MALEYADLRISPPEKIFAPEEAQLLCQHCGGNNLHQEITEVFERVEDAKEGIHATVTIKGCSIDTSMHGVPSARRQGIRIKFSCEGCSRASELIITQHKGTTYLNVNAKRAP